jgi:hypothetical protein
MAAVKGAQLLTETDGPGGEGDGGSAGHGAAGGDRPIITGDLDEEYVLLEEEGEGEGEGRLSTEEAGDRTLLDQRRHDQTKVYTRDEIAAMSPDERRNAWRSMSRDEQRANRPLDRARKKDNRSRGQQDNERLQGELTATQAQLRELKDRFDGFQPKLGEFEKGQLQSRLASIDTELGEVNRKFDDAKRRMSDAIVGQDTEAFNKAMDDRDTMFVRRLQLQGGKELVQKQITAAGAGGAGDGGGGGGGERRAAGGEQRRAGGEGDGQRGQAERRPDPAQAAAVQERVRDFEAEHEWYKPNDPNDPDTAVVRALDRQVAAEGFNPATDEYWDELADRLEQRLPQYFGGQRGGQRQQQQQQQRQQQRPNGARAGGNGNGASTQRRGPPSGGGGDAGARGAGNGKGVRLTPGRKEALVLAGILDRDGKTVIDKVKFQRSLKSYADFDREHADEARR